MSKHRKDLQKAKQRRDRIRREKHAGRAGTPAAPVPIMTEHPFATERALRSVQALLEGQNFNSTDEINDRLAELTGGDRLAELAGAWKQDDPKWRAQELAYDALETDDIVEAMRLAHEAQKLDPDCTDAQRLMVSLIPMELDNRILLMREVVDKAEGNFGAGFFEEHTGHFWDVPTRPYMRAKQHLGELLAEAGKLEEAAVVFERMVELNPNDNQGMRYPLLGLYLATGQKEAAARLMSRFPDEERIMGSFAWARVLERWLAGTLDEAKAALARARKVNPFAGDYILGVREQPKELPQLYRPGEESEAQVCANELAIAWKAHPAFLEWLPRATI
ncbi:MAG TPA: tetratricopeptide repeat protein [Bryobacteraceae bacterium]